MSTKRKFDELTAQEKIVVTAEATLLSQSQPHVYKSYYDITERLAREKIIERQQSVINYNMHGANGTMVNGDDRSKVTISGDDRSKFMISGDFHGNLGSVGGDVAVVSPSGTKKRALSSDDDTPEAKRVKVTSPCPVQALLAGTNNLSVAKKIGTDALDNLHSTKQVLSRARITNESIRAARYRSERNKVRAERNKVRAELEGSRKNEASLRKQLVEAVKQLEVARKNEHYEKERADFFESQSDRLSYFISRL